ncbi:MAG: nitroreductase family deazaflavin-dependent oxidoreductase [Thermomicrobiales bacterium]|nr:nitroreductase family deazaflavin-dependent oxidoreductase [Thermomicrobiales bacterium]
MQEFDRSIVERLRADGGKLGGSAAGAPLLLLTTIGARTGQPRTVPLAYLRDGERWLVMAANRGAPANPGWLHNLLTNPEATIEIGGETIPVRAVVLEGAERDQQFARMVERAGRFGCAPQQTTRMFPVVALERRD